MAGGFCQSCKIERKISLQLLHFDKQLSRREREIMEIVYARGTATAADIREALHDAPSPASVRKLIQILEAKGHLKHDKDGREHVYRPVKAKQTAARRALSSLLETFFGGSLRDAIATHLTGTSKPLPDAELREIAKLIREAQRDTKTQGGES